MSHVVKPRRTDTASRTIPASPEVIYGAFAEADALMAWLPPGDMTGRALEYEFRRGGRYCIELSYPDTTPAGTAKTTDLTDLTTGSFLALEPGKRIVQSVEFESTDPSFAGTMVMTWSFESAPSGTRVTITAEDVPPGISAEDHDAGLQASLDNLARYVLERATSEADGS